MAKYRKRPVVIEATRWWKHGDHLAVRAPSKEEMDYHNLLPGYFRGDGLPGVIDTLEGVHLVTSGDWIITGIKDEIYPCKDDIFQATYELVEN